MFRQPVWKSSLESSFWKFLFETLLSSTVTFAALKGLCHEDFGILDQLCAKIIT